MENNTDKKAFVFLIAIIFIIITVTLIGAYMGTVKPKTSLKSKASEPALTLSLKLKLQGINTQPNHINQMNVKISLAGGTLANALSQAVLMTVDNEGNWIGRTSFNAPSGDGYYLLVKGPKHIQKKVCDLKPTETFPGTYKCDKGKITLTTGENNLDLTEVVLLVGDLPEQNGIVNSYDLSLVRNNLGKNDTDSLASADVNLDGIVNSMDYSLIISALSVKVDEGGSEIADTNPTPTVNPTATNTPIPSTTTVPPTATNTPAPPTTTTTSPQNTSNLPAGIYYYYDWENLDPASYPWIKGGEVVTRWDLIEPSEGSMDWSNFEKWINNIKSKGKGTTLKITAHDRDYSGIPNWIYTKYNVPKIKIGDEKCNYNSGCFYPKWWDNTFITKYTNMIKKMGEKYNNDPRIGAIIVAIGEYGEAFPGYGNLNWDTKPKNHDQYWGEAGLTPDIWISYCKKIIDAYVAAFPDKPLFLLEQNFAGQKTDVLTDYAASYGVNMGFAGLIADNSHNSRWYTPFSKYVEPGNLLGRLEQGYGSTITSRLTYWTILNALRNHAYIIALYAGHVKNQTNTDSFNFANKYAGKKLQDTPGVWIAFKGKPGDQVIWQGHDGNYEYWIKQINPETTTVTVYDWDKPGQTLKNDGPKEGMYFRRTDLSSGKNNFYLNIDDRYISASSNARFNTINGGKQAKITVKYFDSNNGQITIKYDGFAGEKTAGKINKTNTNTWKSAIYTINDAYFNNRLPNNSDLTLTASGQNAVLHMVEVEIN